MSESCSVPLLPVLPVLPVRDGGIDVCLLPALVAADEQQEQSPARLRVAHAASPAVAASRSSISSNIATWHCEVP